MSVFVRQNGNSYGFDTTQSWVILSPIEKRIKEKIEALGTPLREWDISINYGIKTGFNDAFIINGKKRQELITADPKSAEIIRPILRGRDIKKYGYNFADLWLIATLPSFRIDIDHYPAVKQYLLGFGYDRLKQTGDYGSRKRTNNQWFETQDSINYWEDFFKPKIIFQEMVQEPSFFYDKDGQFLCLDTARIITGNNLVVLLALLNSNLFFYAVKVFYGGGGLGEKGVRMKHTFFEKFPMPHFSNKEKDNLSSCVSRLSPESMKEIDQIIYNSFLLSSDEIKFIESE